MLFYRRQPPTPQRPFEFQRAPVSVFDEPNRPVQEIGLPKRLQRAAAAAYLVAASFVIPDEPPTFGFQDRQPRGLPLASPEAYQVSAKIVPPEAIARPVGFISDASHAQPRPPASVFWVDQRITALFDLGDPAANGFQERQPWPAPRAAREAYRPPERDLTVLELGQPATWGIVDNRPRPAPRANPAAYESIRIMPADQQPAAFGFVTIRAPGASRPAPTAYWVEHVAEIEGPDRPAAQGFVTGRAAGVFRAGQDAYLVLAPLVRDEPEIGRVFVEGKPQPQRRAAAAGYAVEPRAGIAEPGRPVAFGHVAEPAKRSPRSAPSAYLAIASFGVIEVPPAFGFIETASRRPPRGSSAAYLPPQTSFVDVAGLPAAFGHVTANVGRLLRSATSAYLVTQSALIADPPFPGAVITPQQAPAARRAAADAYGRMVSLEIADPMPQGPGFVQAAARGPLRSDAQAYQMQMAPQPAEELLIRGHIAEQARPAPRAPATAYHVEGRSTILGGDEPVAWGFIAQRAHGAMRAASVAYVAAVSQPAAAEPGVFGFVAQPLPPRRAGAGAYLVAAFAPPPEVPAATGFVETASRKAPRAAATAYWLPPSAEIVGLDVPAAWGFVERQPLRVVRAAPQSYLVTTTFAQPEIIRTGPLVQVYGASSELVMVFGSDGGRVQVYGEEGGQKGVRGAT